MSSKRSRWYIVLLAMVLTISACGSATPSTSNSGSTIESAPTTVAATDETDEVVAEPTEATSEEVESSSETAAPIEIEFWHSITGDFGTVLEQLVADYNENQDAVVVTSVYKGNYQDTQTALLAALAADDQPDVMQLEGSFSASLASRGVLAPIEEFIQDPDIGLTDEQFNAIYPKLADATRLDGVMMTIPFNNSMPVLYYNTELLEAAGVEAPETWDEFAEACQAVSSDSGSPFGLTINSGNVWVWEAMVWQNNGELFNEDYTEVLFNEPEAVEALQYWVDLVESGCAQLQPWEEGRTTFFTGNVAFYEDSSGGLGGVIENSPFEVGVTHIPWGENQVVTIGGANLGIFAGIAEEKQAAAWDFIKFLTSAESISRQSADTGYLPITAEAVEIEPLKGVLEADPRLSDIVQWIEYVTPRPSVEGYAEIQTYLREAFESALLGQTSAQEALDTAAEKAQQVLDQ